MVKGSCFSSFVTCPLRVIILSRYDFDCHIVSIWHLVSNISGKLLELGFIQIIIIIINYYYLSRVVRKPAFCICENKDADQLRGNREADQRLCFRYTDSTIPSSS